jgi:hypothetical protein
MLAPAPMTVEATIGWLPAVAVSSSPQAAMTACATAV